MDYVKDSFDKETVTVIGNDGKQYSMAAFIGNAGGGATAPVSHIDMMAYEQAEDYGQYFYEYSKDCKCCKGFVYNCEGMQRNDISCVGQCFCLTEMMHN